jgi:hypothetical protein
VVEICEIHETKINRADTFENEIPFSKAVEFVKECPIYRS